MIKPVVVNDKGNDELTKKDESWPCDECKRNFKSLIQCTTCKFQYCEKCKKEWSDCPECLRSNPDGKGNMENTRYEDFEGSYVFEYSGDDFSFFCDRYNLKEYEKEEIGSTYDNELLDYLKNGYYVYTYLDGSVYKGEWKEYKRHGKGKQTYPTGVTYEGNWANGKYEGCGTKIQINGYIYKGCWKKGVRNGKGKEINSNGDTFKGLWINDNKEGEGIYKCITGREIKGIWKKKQ